jgi:hypothetical protein
MSQLEELKKLHHGSLTEVMVDLVASCPCLEWKDEFCPSDYIDRVYARDMSAPVMWGIDRWGRFFVAVRSFVSRVETKNKKTNKIEIETYDEKKSRPATEIFFQRYSQEPNTWTSGSTHLSTNQIIVSRMYDEQFNSLKQLIESASTTSVRDQFENIVSITLSLI